MVTFSYIDVESDVRPSESIVPLSHLEESVHEDHTEEIFFELSKNEDVVDVESFLDWEEIKVNFCCADMKTSLLFMSGFQLCLRKSLQMDRSIWTPSQKYLKKLVLKKV